MVDLPLPESPVNQSTALFCLSTRIRASRSTEVLVVDIGVRFPLSKADVADKLGYRGVAPVSVPGPLLDLLPVGPSLDPEAAKATMPVAGQ